MLHHVLTVLTSKPVIVTAVGVSCVQAYRKRSRVQGMTPERVKIYQAALTSLKDAGRLRTLADAFASQGLQEQAKLLRQRADLNDAPKEVKLERREIYRRALRSKDPSAVLNMAAAFDAKGATGAAFNLRQYAAALIKLGPQAAAIDVSSSAPAPEPAAPSVSGDPAEDSADDTV